MAKYKYLIGSLNWQQSELTWKQDRELWDLYIRLAEKAPDESVDINEILELFTKHDLVADALNIILRPVKDARYYWHKFKNFFSRSPLLPAVADATNSTIQNIFEDFFLLNKTLLTRLATFTNTLGMIAETILNKVAEAEKKSLKQSAPRPASMTITPGKGN